MGKHLGCASAAAGHAWYRLKPILVILKSRVSHVKKEVNLLFKEMLSLALDLAECIYLDLGV